MHKIPIDARFIVTSKNCSTKSLSDVISKGFKMIFNHVESFHRKTLFYKCFKKFWVVENLFPVVTKLIKINTKKKAKSISTFDITALYTTIPHNLLIEVLSEVRNFVSQAKPRGRIGFSKTSIHWTLKGCGQRYLTT